MTNINRVAVLAVLADAADKLTAEKLTRQEDERAFHLHGWGECHPSSLYAFVAFPGKKHWRDLELNETTEGRFQNPTSDKKPERLTRVR